MSTKTNGVVQDEWNLTVQAGCWDSVAALTVPAADYEYQIDGLSQEHDMTPTFTPSLGASCDYTLAIDIKPTDDSSDYEAVGSGSYTWITNPTDTFTARINNDASASYSTPTEYTVRWHYSINESVDKSTLVTDAYDYAQLTLVDQCYYNTWSVDTYTEDINFEFMADPVSNSPITKTMKIVPSIAC